MNPDVRIRASLGAFAMLVGAAIVCGLMQNVQLRTVPMFEVRMQQPSDTRIEKYPEPEIPIGAPGFTPLDEKKEGLFDRIRARRSPTVYTTQYQPTASKCSTSTVVSTRTIATSQPAPMYVSQPTPAPQLPDSLQYGESIVSQGVLQEGCVPCQPNYKNTPPAFQPHTYQPQYQPTYAQLTPSLVHSDVFTRPTEKKYKLALFVDGSMKSNAVLNWFSSNANLAKLKAASDVQLYSPTDTLYLTRHQALVPRNTFPAVFVLDQRGGQIYAAGGADMPASSDTMWADIFKSKENYDSVQQGMINRMLAQQSWPVNYSPQYDPLPRFNAQQPPCDDGNCDPEQPPVDAFDRFRTPPKPAIDLAGLNVEQLACLAVIGITAFVVWTHFRKP